MSSTGSCGRIRKCTKKTLRRCDQPIFVGRATPIVKESIGQTYKMRFLMDTDDVDPDMSCNP